MKLPNYAWGYPVEQLVRCTCYGACRAATVHLRLDAKAPSPLERVRCLRCGHIHRGWR